MPKILQFMVTLDFESKKGRQHLREICAMVDRGWPIDLVLVQTTHDLVPDAEIEADMPVVDLAEAPVLPGASRILSEPLAYHEGMPEPSWQEPTPAEMPEAEQIEPAPVETEAEEETPTLIEALEEKAEAEPAAPVDEPVNSGRLTEEQRIEAWRMWFDLGLDEDEIAVGLDIKSAKIKALISAVTSRISVIPGTRRHYEGEARAKKVEEAAKAGPDTPDLEGWTLREDAELTRLKALGKSDGAIATAFKRKPPAIRHRLALIEADLGTDIKGAADMLAEDLRRALAGKPA